MNWFAPGRRSLQIGEAFGLAFALALATPFCAAIATQSGSPSPFDILFGFLPFLLFAGAVGACAFMVGGRERFVQAISSSLAGIGIACAVSFVASLLHLWNGNASMSVLPPFQAFLSIISFGIWPFRFGPDVLLRFFPLTIVAFTAIRLSRAHLRVRSIVLTSVVVYLALAIALHAMSFVAGALAIGRPMPLSSAADAFRVLVSSQSNGYWTRAQADRFFVPLGQQAAGGIVAMQAAMLFVWMCVISVTLFLTRMRGATLLLKRLASRSTLLLLFQIVIGVSLAWSFRIFRGSMTDLFAFCVFAFVCIAWLLWRRCMFDLENIPRDERERPYLPLPSGAVASHEVEQLCTVLLCFAILGSLLLGWPVAIGLFVATVFAWVLMRAGGGWRDGVATYALGAMGMALCLGWASSSFGMRDLSVPNWLARLLMFGALLVGLFYLLRKLQEVVRSPQAFRLIFCIGLFLPAMIASQAVVWVATVCATIAYFILLRDARFSASASVRAIETLCAIIAAAALFFPQVFRFL